jgi:hypothetical protein
VALFFLLAVLLLVVLLIAIFAFPSEKVSRWLTKGDKEKK